MRLAFHPRIDLSLDLSSRPVERISDRVDVAIRLGPLPDSSLVAVRLGHMRRLLCASPAYLRRKGTPMTVQDLAEREVIEMPGPDGPRWDCPPVDVHLVFPSRRELAPSVRAFVDFMNEMNPPRMHWQDNELHAIE